MVKAPGVAVPPKEAEGKRRELMEEGALRDDLEVLHTEEGIVFPVEGALPGAEEYEFTLRAKRPRHYTHLLDWDERDRRLAPRAFDAVGDVVVVKVPPALWPRRGDIGRALLAFLPRARAAFHDHGVEGEHRVRALERIAGEGPPATVVQENHVQLEVDLARAYYSPRLADERARLVGLLRPGKRVIDLFAGVAPFGVQAAKAGAQVECVDINPDACEMARRNAERNKVPLTVHCGDAREVAPRLLPADHVVLNLPHEAKHFLPVAVPLVRPRGTLHHHEILRPEEVEARTAALVSQIAGLGRAARVAGVRHVRAYSATETHYAIDLEVQ